MNICKTILRKIIKSPSDRTKKYWENAASNNLEKTMNFICDGFDRKTFETKKEGIINVIKFEKHMKILDLACGIGRTCRWVSPLVEEYCGVDFIPEMIKKAREYNHFENSKFFTNNGKTLGMFSDNYFDIVYCELAFQHMLKPIQKSYVDEVYRVLKKGGIFYVQIPKLDYYHDSSYSRTKKESDALFSSFDFTYEQGHEAYYTVKSIHG